MVWYFLLSVTILRRKSKKQEDFTEDTFTADTLSADNRVRLLDSRLQRVLITFDTTVRLLTIHRRENCVALSYPEDSCVKGPPRRWSHGDAALSTTIPFDVVSPRGAHGTNVSHIYSEYFRASLRKNGERFLGEIITIFLLKGDQRHVTCQVTCRHETERYYVRSSASHVFYLSIEPDTTSIPLGVAGLAGLRFQISIRRRALQHIRRVARRRRARKLKGCRGNAVIL